MVKGARERLDGGDVVARSGAPAASGIPQPATRGAADAPSPAYVTDFLATSDGLALVKAFMCIEDAKLRRAIVRLVEEIVPETASGTED